MYWGLKVIIYGVIVASTPAVDGGTTLVQLIVRALVALRGAVKVNARLEVFVSRASVPTAEDEEVQDAVPPATVQSSVSPNRITSPETKLLYPVVVTVKERLLEAPAMAGLRLKPDQEKVGLVTVNEKGLLVVLSPEAAW